MQFHANRWPGPQRIATHTHTYMYAPRAHESAARKKTPKYNPYALPWTADTAQRNESMAELKVWIWLRTCVEKFHFFMRGHTHTHTIYCSWELLHFGSLSYLSTAMCVRACVCVSDRVPAIVLYYCVLQHQHYSGNGTLAQFRILLSTTQFSQPVIHSSLFYSVCVGCEEAKVEWEHYICSIYQIKLTDTNSQESYAKWINYLSCFIVLRRFWLWHCHRRWR